MDPAERRRGVPRGNKPGGRPRGVKRSYDKRKPLAAPSLRRDPTCQEKLAVVVAWERACKAEGVQRPRQLQTSTKRELEKTWHWLIETVARWFDQKTAFLEFVSKARLGKHGLRPWGSTAGLVSKRTRSLGKRMSNHVRGVATVVRPLDEVMERLERWMKQERQYRHEVRGKTIAMRIKYELEYERDRQLVLEQHQSEDFKPFVLEKCSEKLAFFQITRPSKRQERWVDEVVKPRIGATARGGQKLSQSADLKLDEKKAKLTWATADRAIHLVSRGTEDQLRIFVSEPEAFVERRASTSIVVCDATALWVKLRGEEKVYVHEDEKTSVAFRKRLSKAFKKLDQNNAEEVRDFEAQKEAFFDVDHRDHKGQVDAAYSSAGDKYRITLVNISGVEGWFDASEAPRASKKRSILLVPCAKHCRVSDMDLERGEWLRDVQYERTDGEMQIFKAGEKINSLLAGWRAALLKFTEQERAEIFEQIDIWGQPRAWTDELIASWTIDFIRAEYGQAVCFADCLSSQWTEAICLKAWLENVVWVPYAPDVTSFLQEPDTHEHSQLKAEIREVKSELHWALESEWVQQKKKIENHDLQYPASWGPWECIYVVSEAYKRFREKYKGKVPLEGLQANQMLRVRPTALGPEGRLELVTGSELNNPSKLP